MRIVYTISAMMRGKHVVCAAVLMMMMVLMGVHGTAIVTNYGLSCANAPGCKGIRMALTASSLLNGAKITLQPVNEGDELLDTQDWTVDTVSNRIYLSEYPYLVLAKTSLTNSKAKLIDSRQMSTSDQKMGQWAITVDNRGFWTFKQTSFSPSFLTVFSGVDGVHIETLVGGAVGSIQFFPFDPIPVFDYVIVGAGTAGAKLAKLLSDGGRVSVAVLEAGIRQDDNPLIQSPREVRAVEKSPVYNFQYYSDVIPGLAGQTYTVGVGKMWGGTSNHNGMLYDRGLRYDWDLYSKYGGAAWAYDSIKDLYTSQENYSGVTPGFGKGGELDISDSTTFPAPVADVIINATQKVWPGFVKVGSLNADVKVGAVTKFELTQQNKGGGIYIREGASSAYLNATVVDPVTGKGVAGRKLTIFSRAFATKLIFHRIRKHKVVGVEYQTGKDDCMKILARREVILTAGAYNSPSLLMRSGVGNCTYLESINITCVFNNPYVGQNLQDHTRVQMAVGLPAYATNAIAATVLPYNTDGHLLEGRVITDLGTAYTDYSVTNETQADTKFSTVYTLQSPNVNIPVLYDLNWVQGGVPVKAPIIEFAGILLRPKCVGSVKIVSALPNEIPQINHDYLCHPDDKNWARMMYRNFIKIVENLKPYDPVYSAKFPTAEMVNDTATFERLLPVLTTGYRHPSGSLRVGAFNSVQQGAISGNMCVHGISGVRVADASVFPLVPSNNPMSAVYIVAGLAARLVKNGAAC